MVYLINYLEGNEWKQFVYNDYKLAKVMIEDLTRRVESTVSKITAFHVFAVEEI